MDETGLRLLLSSNIKRLRGKKGLSQEKLAEKIEMSTNYLSIIETGKGWVSPLTLVNLANALEIEVFELFIPQKQLPKDISTVVNRYLEDFSTSLRISFDKSINESLQRMRKTF